MYNKQLGMSGKAKFLKRSEEEEEHYAEMNQGEYGEESDPDNIIEDLQNNMVNVEQNKTKLTESNT